MVQVKQPENYWLPIDIHDKTWSQLTDPTALEVGNWIFDTSNGAYYAGQIVTIDHRPDGTLIRLTWHKAPSNVFPWSEILTVDRMEQLLWIDPMEEGNCDAL